MVLIIYVLMNHISLRKNAYVGNTLSAYQTYWRIMALN